ncbi:DUF2283 domain-containing protein [Candidatus Woesearchaeota archaeon]|nr:DUF2283 domain-containing protein [Candidatus Woesearchaeota archaeon]
MKHLSYDKEQDILAIHKGFTKDEKFKGNIDAGQLILDVSTKGRIRGIEILDATGFFKDFKINKDILENLIDAKFNAKINPNGIILGINFLAKEKEIPAKVAVPLPAR